jgi:hypothetical protein
MREHLQESLAIPLRGKNKASVEAVLTGIASRSEQQRARNWLTDELNDQAKMMFLQDVTKRQEISGHLLRALEELHFKQC